MNIKDRYQRKKLRFSIRKECDADDELLGKAFILDVWGVMQEVNRLSNRDNRRARFYWYSLLDFFETDTIFSDCGAFPCINIPPPAGLVEWAGPEPVHDNMIPPSKGWSKKLPVEG